jgi:hypothetical protein
VEGHAAVGVEDGGGGGVAVVVDVQVPTATLVGHTALRLGLRHHRGFRLPAATTGLTVTLELIRPLQTKHKRITRFVNFQLKYFIPSREERNHGLKNV